VIWSLAAVLLIAPLLVSLSTRLPGDRLPPRATVLALAASAVAVALAGVALLSGHVSYTVAVMLAGGPEPWWSWYSLPLWLAMILSAGRTGHRLLRALRAAHRQAALLPAGTSPAVLPDPRVQAFALPGRPGRVVLTQGLVEALADDQARAVLAHEHAHLTGRHHRLLAWTRVAAAAQPLLGALPAAVAHDVERWADECAASSVAARPGTERATGPALRQARSLVASAIGTVALHTAAQQLPAGPAAQQPPAGPRERAERGTARTVLRAGWAALGTGQPVLALHGGAGAVPRRMAALLAPQPPRWRALWLAVPLATSVGAWALTGDGLGELLELWQAHRDRDR
jgi:Zn-dependent protease with chaperone function